jgi:hypothetical protein
LTATHAPATHTLTEILALDHAAREHAQYWQRRVLQAAGDGTRAAITRS